MNLNGFDVRFTFGDSYQTSNITTNEVTDDETLYFAFEDEFKDNLDFFASTYDGDGNGIRATISFNPPITESEHIIAKDEIGYVVNTDGGVLLR